MEPIQYSDGGCIVEVGGSRSNVPVFNKSVFQRPAPEILEQKIVEGFACRYNLPHVYKGRFEVFQEGCFNRALSRKSRVDYCIDHDLSFSLGNTDDNLELIDTKHGLSFRLRPRMEHVGRIGSRTGMSVSYIESDVETRRVANEDVRFIKAAFLIEISACNKGAVKQAHLLIRDETKTGSFRDDCQTGFRNDAAYVALRRALSEL